MINENETKNFSGWWAILFIFLTFNIAPIPFALSIGLFRGLGVSESNYCEYDLYG